MLGLPNPAVHRRTELFEGDCARSIGGQPCAVAPPKAHDIAPAEAPFRWVNRPANEREAAGNWRKLRPVFVHGQA